MKWEDSQITYLGVIRERCQRCDEEPATDFIVWYVEDSNTKSIVKFYCKDCAEVLVRVHFPEGIPQEPM